MQNEEPEVFMMINTEDFISVILSEGAYKAAAIGGENIVLSREFRALCEKNSCGKYGRCWVCPPDCGEIDALMDRVQSYRHALVYQTVGTLEDSFDIEGMIAAREKHQEVAQKVAAKLGELLSPGFLHLGPGGCGLCEECAKLTGEPCRHPAKALIPVEGCGIDVAATVSGTPLKYINGANTVTYFGMILYN